MVITEVDLTLPELDEAIDHAWKAGHLDVVDLLLDHRWTLSRG